MKNITLWTTLAFFIIAFPAQAQEEFQFTGYIGAGFGMSRLDPDTNNTGFSVDDTNDFGYKVIAGYDWTPRISTELYYADLGEAKIKPSGQVSYQDFGISGLFYFYHETMDRTGLALFGKIGVGRMDNDSDLPFNRQNDAHILLGAGGEYSLARQITLRFEAEFFDEDSQFYSVNLLKRF